MPTTALLLAALLTTAPPTTQPDEPWLSVPQDWRGYLDQQLGTLIYKPPADAVRVRLRRKDRPRHLFNQHGGWLVAGKDGAGPRIYSTDGWWIPAPPADRIVRVDFLAVCRKLIEHDPERTPPQSDLDTPEFRLFADDPYYEPAPDVALAAWLHLRGHDELAEPFLRRADREAKLAPSLAASLAADHAKRVRGEFSLGRDAEAWRSSQWLLDRYPEQAKSFGQASAIIEDLKRRRQEGNFGQRRPLEPEGYKDWPIERKVAYRIQTLDEVNARQFGFPGDVPLGGDPYVLATVELGDAAVPALIDAVEKDGRLIRSVHAWRFWTPGHFLQVRDAALAALEMILRERFYVSRHTADDFSIWPDEDRAKLVAEIRTYWKAYGRLDFQARMMAMLADEKLPSEQWRSAAERLATPGHWDGEVLIGYAIFQEDAGPNPAVKRFKDPTAVEAIVAALDRELDLPFPAVYEALDAYLPALMKLADKRIAGKLSARAGEAADLAVRCRYAEAAHRLGDASALQALAHDASAGKADLGRSDLKGVDPWNQPASRNLGRLLDVLILARTDFAERALAGLVQADHPWYPRLRTMVLAGGGGRLLEHSAVVVLLTRELRNETPIHPRPPLPPSTQRDDGMAVVGDILQVPVDPTFQPPPRPTWFCDPAARRLAEIVWGIGPSRPGEDDDAFVQRVRKVVNRHRIRPMTPTEARGLIGAGGLFGDERWLLILDMPPLGRPATPGDVTAGRAVFHLAGNGKLTDAKLPTVAELLSDEEKQRRREEAARRPATAPDEEESDVWSGDGGLFGGDENSALVVQAELDADGKIHYGVIAENGLRRVNADDLDRFRPLDENDADTAPVQP